MSQSPQLLDEHGACHRILRLALSSDLRPVIVGIDGGAGSGKSTLACLLRDRLLSLDLVVLIFSFDAFWVRSKKYRALLKAIPQPWTLRYEDYEYDWKACRACLLLPLFSKGLTSDPMQRLAFAHALAGGGKPEHRNGVVAILEGVTSQRKELRDLYDIRIFVSDKDGMALGRAVSRDGAEFSGYYHDVWKSREQHYLAHHRPEQAAHFMARSIPKENVIELLSQESNPR